MPRYYFHVRDGVAFNDDVGTELPDEDAARAEAVRSSGEMLRDVGGRFWNSDEWLMSVVDESGAHVCGLRFSAKRGELRR
jgi:hypothetical protein